VRLLRHMDTHGLKTVVPVPDGDIEPAPLLDLTSGYLQRANGRLPVAGDRDPWRLRHNYFLDKRFLRTSRVDDGVVEFSA